MGQCYTTIQRAPGKAFSGHQGIASNRATKKTLRGDEYEEGGNVQGAVRFNLGDGREIYRGMKVQGIIEELSQEDLLLAVRGGKYHVVEALCARHKLTNVCEIRGIQGNFELLQREVYNIANWNLLLLAIAFDHLDAIQLFAVKLKSHLRIALRTPPIASFSKVQESDPAHAETFSLLLAINNRSQTMLKFIWSDLRLLWDSFHFTYVIGELASQRFVEGIRVLLRSQTSHEIYMSMHAAEKLRFLRIALATDKRHSRKWSLEIKEVLKEELTGQHPYATVALFVLLNDESQVRLDSQASYHLNKLHLERALDHMDPVEYARFKTTIGQVDPGYPNVKGALIDFGQLVTKRLTEYILQEESPNQRAYGEKLKRKLEQLDQDVVKLRAQGLVNPLDYDIVFGQKLFSIAESGSLSEFCEVVEQNDVRLFSKRKKLETISKFLPKSFSGISRYGYFSPLLVAIQQGHHALVSFIIEQMKVPLRQSLCLYHSDPGSLSSQIDSVSEEYQSYALLIATLRKDEQMLRYLWQCLGTYLWTERHFEPLMRALIETQWPEGIKIIFEAEMTHDMIRALSSEERAFFVENMIGDVLNLGQQAEESSLSSFGDTSNLPDTRLGALIVQKTIKEELCKQPYAGLFILYMIGRFEELSDEDFLYWDKCCQMTADTSLLNKEEKSQIVEKSQGTNFFKNIMKKRGGDSMTEDPKRDSITSSNNGENEIKYGVYTTELVLLAKSNQSRFSKFILTYGLKRKDDRFRQEATKFIECLRHLPEFQPLIEEGTEEAIMNGEEEVKFMKKDLQDAQQKLIGPSTYLVDLIKFTITGNWNQILKLLPQASIDQDAHSLHLLILNTRGLSVKAFDHSKENTIINTREWNPVHYAIYFQQFKLLQTFTQELSGVAPGGLGADLKSALGFSRTDNEFVEFKEFDERLGISSSESHLYGIMLCILTRNMAVFKYIFGEIGIQFNENDILRMLNLCLEAHWPLGFLQVINSQVTANIFVQGSLDFKEEFIRFALVECESLVSKNVSSTKAPSQIDEDIIREVKDRMTEHPYNCISWLYFDPIHKELKNQRYIKRLQEPSCFNVETLQVLSYANQLQEVLKKCDKPRINCDFLVPSGIDQNQIKISANAQDGDEDEDELALKNRQEDILNQKIYEHKLAYVNRTQQILQEHPQQIKRNLGYPDLCEQIVTQVFQKVEIQDRYINYIKLITPFLGENPEKQGERHALLLRFVAGYYDFGYWRKLQLNAPIENIEMDRLNLLQWMIFYNEHQILEEILTNATGVGNHLMLLQALVGDHIPIECYGLKIDKVGLVIGICRKSYQCLKVLLIPRSDNKWSRNLLTSHEVLELALLIAHRGNDVWQGIVQQSTQTPSLQTKQPTAHQSLERRLIELIESSFVACSLQYRQNFLKSLLNATKVTQNSLLSSLLKEAPHVKYLCQWIQLQQSDDYADLRSLLVKMKLVIKEQDQNYESEIARLRFISRLKPEKVQSNLIEQVNNNNNLVMKKQKSTNNSQRLTKNLNLPPSSSSNSQVLSSAKDSAEIDSD